MDKLPNNLRLKKPYKSFKNVLINMNRDLMHIDNYIEEEKTSIEIDDLQYYILALEDRRFLKHSGVDFKACIRELVKVILRKPHGGASTIDMQLVRTLTDYREMTFKRKIYEMSLAVLINFRYTKSQILNCYMQNAYLGNNIIGYSDAIKIRFPSRTRATLTKEEASSLAAMLLRPMPSTPSAKWFEENASRARYAQNIRIFVKKSYN